MFRCHALLGGLDDSHEVCHAVGDEGSREPDEGVAEEAVPDALDDPGCLGKEVVGVEPRVVSNDCREVVRNGPLVKNPDVSRLDLPDEGPEPCCVVNLKDRFASVDGHEKNPPDSDENAGDKCAPGSSPIRSEWEVRKLSLGVGVREWVKLGDSRVNFVGRICFAARRS